jgi:hypothetical protein
VHPSIFHARHPVVACWSEDRALIPLEHAYTRPPNLTGTAVMRIVGQQRLQP